MFESRQSVANRFSESCPSFLILGMHSKRNFPLVTVHSKNHVAVSVDEIVPGFRFELAKHLIHKPIESLLREFTRASLTGVSAIIIV
jgi:hypothetical protein